MTAPVDKEIDNRYFWMELAIQLKRNVFTFVKDGFSKISREERVYCIFGRKNIIVSSWLIFIVCSQRFIFFNCGTYMPFTMRLLQQIIFNYTFYNINIYFV